MKKNIALITLLLSTNTLAAGGFTWLGAAQEALHTHYPWHVVTFVLIGILLTAAGFLYRMKISAVTNPVIPDKGITFRNIVEAYGKFIYSQCNAVLGTKDAPVYFKFVATIFILIFASNIIGLIPGFLPPTEHLSTTLALGCFSFIYFNAKGCKELGTINYLKHFAGPLWYMAVLIFPIEILSTCIRPVSLALRLNGNMMGDHKVLTTFLNLEVMGFKIAWLGGAIPFYLLGLLVCFIQAYVFTMLSMVYISLATAHHDHAEHH
ncbi:F0F1 ATP synthase subunit A [Halobacteriovorax sp. HLS]|uniref:F0F1 ATP synthase subunit A n=1 Tax=Halobacteriovorax sp. HLS TaxID=2234000 RepID=UPI000FDAA641|nr:F0F1 ATP synthase subunit A [Halobacteriovorax sp. HLS]